MSLVDLLENLEKTNCDFSARDPFKAMIIAEQIRKKVENCEFVAQNRSIRLTVSLGVANCPKHILTADGLIKKTDAVMSRAKELFKNSIKVTV
jgi:diguanylate cyclase (GGDEF)-like protein